MVLQLRLDCGVDRQGEQGEWERSGSHHRQILEPALSGFLSQWAGQDFLLWSWERQDEQGDWRQGLQAELLLLPERLEAFGPAYAGWLEQHQEQLTHSQLEQLKRSDLGLYHVAPTQARAQIQQQGLLPWEPGRDTTFVHYQPRPQLYLWREQQHAEQWAEHFAGHYPDTQQGNADIWEIRPGERLRLAADPRLEADALATPEPIAPERLRLRGTYQLPDYCPECERPLDGDRCPRC